MSSSVLRRYSSTGMPLAKRLGSENLGFLPTLRKPYSFLLLRLIVKWVGALAGSTDFEICAVGAVHGWVGRGIGVPLVSVLVVFGTTRMTRLGSKATSRSPSPWR